ncbi:preprotein translocase subunit SecA [Candidatus Dojkabacteria bacterium]|nr:preprotein translocase subunit SecA [Candidatus Dojkabacteria bacterium]
MFKFLKKFFDQSTKAIKKVHPIVDEINALESEFEKKSKEELTQMIDKFRAELKPLNEAIPNKYKSSLKVPDKDEEYVAKEEKLKAKLLSFMPQVYAAIREIVKRQTGKRHYDVQLIASIILAQGYHLTELKTGEGKTLVFQMTAALYGLTGRGSHVVTVNDYLARIHGEYAGHLLHQLGITVGVITPQQSYRFIPNEEVGNYKGEEAGQKAIKQNISNPGDGEGLNLLECTKKEAYACDIVYGTNNEFGFDYLRDNMTTSLDDIVQRELYFCIVDEADSILIDEARTPLIISAPAEKSNELYIRFAQLVPKLKEDKDYTVDEKAHSVTLTDEGAEKMEKMLGVQNIWQDYKLAHHLENALKAMKLYVKDNHYIVKEGQVYIVDDFTGRVLKGRRYSEGLHQAIEAKEGVEIKRESKTLGTITFQNFFRLYKILSGGSGTIMTEAEEFYKIYNLTSVEVPTHRPVIRIDHTDRVYKHRQAKFNAVVEEVIELHKKGQPILIGTTSIEDSEYVSKLLENRGIDHQVLNAKYHERESKIVANAGKKGAVTVATNMAGRGTDIKLGGKKADKEDFEEVVELGGLAVIGTQRHDARRIDNQLRGRSGRQGEPGMSRFYVALDDQIMRIQGGEMVQRIMEMTNIPDDMPIEAKLIGRSIEGAQKRMEGMHFDSRKTVVEYDDVVNQQREIYYARRRRLLEEIEDSIKEQKKSNKKDESGNPLKITLWNKLEKEITQLVQKHFLESREDELDREKVVDDYLDLGPDGLLAEGMKQEGIKATVSNIKKKLINQIEEKEESQIIQTLISYAKGAFEIKIKEFGDDLPNVSKFLILRTMDELWTEHLDAMRDLRDGIGLRGMAQKDPLVEYKNEGFEIFQQFIDKIDSQVARRVLKIQKIVTPAQIQRDEPQETNVDELKDVSTGTREVVDAVNATMNENQQAKSLKTQPQQTVVKSIDIGRNDRITVRYKDGNVKEDIKYKKVQDDIKAGLCEIIGRE